MFKWIALSVATLGIAALAFCFWPRTHVEGSRIVTPSGHVFTLAGDEVFDPVQAEFDRHMRELQASDAQGMRGPTFVPAPPKPGETEEERKARELDNWMRSYANEHATH